jgi:EAL domain-containing protein (putative c-di-GMP-specific phosphodiesterase class I)
MGIKTIAEFVSNADIADKTKQAGVDFWQGYHLGAPALLG